MSARLFPALLKYWRNRHGQSQLDLALESGVSARHISFLESGRAMPSEEMVLRLVSVLGLSLRDQNEALTVAGYAPRFPEPELQEISPEIEWAIDRMLAQQEPYPMTVLSSDYCIFRRNVAAGRIFQLFMANPPRPDQTPNMFALVFDPAQAKPFVVDWPQVAHHMLARLHREALQNPGDARLPALLDRVMQYPDVKDEWRRPDFSAELGSTLSICLRRGELAVRFMTTVTTFAAPRLVTLEELRIESYFPLDQATREICEKLHLVKPGSSQASIGLIDQTSQESSP
ncbi:MAG TPA: helix-turn-helix transcriptional regulator [Polaromonas sp.]|uniref:helix-turn-helix transcriptional regulator n=1 Tax=Polaromonas sp. TaxID=1869339 RepID=UPI002D6278A6|nr:helix-turn-helix transcriptional regulator [Polaromonas sp.]HYW56121.1 helix-turn-helix transcriptional regulator [Polaromonas sp.]